MNVEQRPNISFNFHLSIFVGDMELIEEPNQKLQIIMIAVMICFYDHDHAKINWQLLSFLTTMMIKRIKRKYNDREDLEESRWT